MVNSFLLSFPLSTDGASIKNDKQSSYFFRDGNMNQIRSHPSNCSPSPGDRLTVCTSARPTKDPGVTSVPGGPAKLRPARTSEGLWAIVTVSLIPPGSAESVTSGRCILAVSTLNNRRFISRCLASGSLDLGHVFHFPSRPVFIAGNSSFSQRPSLPPG